jgi:prolyl oligopeptidase
MSLNSLNVQKNRKGIWRKTTMSSYENKHPRWTAVLDVDELASRENTPWVWRGSRVLPRARDSMSENGKRVTRALISLSRGGSDAVVTREFDLLTSEFVIENAFNLQEAKTRASYKSRDILLVGSDFGPDSLTNAGYPRCIREWVRGTDVMDARVVFEGKKSDIAVSAYIDDQRVRGGGLYEVRTRALTFKTSKYWVRKVKYEHLLTEDDPKRAGAGDPPEFKQLEVPDDSEVDFVGNVLMLTLRSDWSPESGKKFLQDSIIYVNAHKFIKYGPKDRIYHVLFQPSERIACENYSVTKKFLVLSIMENMKSKLEFYKLEKDANKLRLVGMDKNPQIRAINVRAVDPYEGDEFWLTTSGYTEPSTLWLADASKMDSRDKKLVRKTGSEGYIVRKLKALPDQFDATNLDVVQKFVASKDGTEIPYFMILKKGTTFNKTNPTLLYGYGGFEVSLGPHYVAPTGLAWLERGGVYVEANIRGGGEFGPSWHEVRRKRPSVCPSVFCITSTHEPVLTRFR